MTLALGLVLAGVFLFLVLVAMAGGRRAARRGDLDSPTFPPLGGDDGGHGHHHGHDAGGAASHGHGDGGGDAGGGAHAH